MEKAEITELNLTFSLWIFEFLRVFDDFAPTDWADGTLPNSQHLNSHPRYEKCSLVIENQIYEDLREKDARIFLKNFAVSIIFLKFLIT